jgi:[acyl-carrier-protein] S-malonyltransferase
MVDMSGIPNTAYPQKFAITFAGQGSQSVGMMAGFAANTIIRDTFDEASALINTDLWEIIVNGPAEVQNKTINTQPLMLTAGVATWRAWQAATSLLPTHFAGHSLGEYTALVASGALTFQDALPMVRFRAEAMQSAVPDGVGAIAAILGLSADAVRQVCLEAADGEVLEAVNLNSPGQIVIAGKKNAVERGMAMAKIKGAKRALMLPMSVPSHCALMKPAAEKLRIYLKDVMIKVPTIPVIQNADVVAFNQVEEIKLALVRQLYQPVRWIETIDYIAHAGAPNIIECVPGKILTGLNRRIDSTLNCMAVIDNASLQTAIAHLLGNTENVHPAL